MEYAIALLIIFGFFYGWLTSPLTYYKAKLRGYTPERLAMFTLFSFYRHHHD